MNKIFIWEDKLTKWIMEHKISWLFILFVMGFCLGYFSLHKAKFGFFYGGILMLIEIFMGGSGLEEN